MKWINKLRQWVWVGQALPKSIINTFNLKKQKQKQTYKNVSLSIYMILTKYIKEEKEEVAFPLYSFMCFRSIKLTAHNWQKMKK